MEIVFSSRVIPDVPVCMGMEINKAGLNGQPACINDTGGFDTIKIADLCDPVTGDGDVARIAGRSGTINDGAIDDQ